MTDSADTRAPAPSGVVGTTIKKLARVVPEALQGFLTDQCPQQAAAIAYRVLFSIAPLAIVLVSIFGLVLRDDSVRQDLVDKIVDALPVAAGARQDVEDAITALATPASAAGLVSLVVFVWAATGMMTSLRRGLECAMGVTESRPMARGKLVDLVLILGAAALVLVSVGLTLLGNLLQRRSGALSEVIGLGGGFRLAIFALSVLVVLLLYRFVPARGLRFRDGLAGAVLTALMFEAISLASGWIYGQTTSLSVVYGSLTTALVFLYSTYLYSSALLLGAEAAAAWARPPSTDVAEPIATQLRRAAVGLFVKQKVGSDREAPPSG